MSTCCVDKITEWPRAASDFLGGTVEVNVTIDTQPVAITFDGGTTFIDAEWVGAAGTTRDWLAYITPDLLPDAMTVEVFVRITDDSDPLHPVTALIEAGTITFI